MHRNRGFTLIELLIVVAIIAILAAIAVPNLLEAQTRSKVARTKADVRACVTALEAYRADNGNLPYGTNIATYQNLWVGQIEFLRWKTDLGEECGLGFRLTTPVTYITSIPIDAFNTKAFKTQSPHNWVQTGSLPATKRPVQWASVFMRGARPGLVYNTSFGPGRNFPYTYLLESAGPDLIPWPAQNQDPFYDPTNGTTSKGDIFYIEGIGFNGAKDGR